MNRVQKRTLREINRRVEASREINGAEMRAVMRSVASRVDEGRQIDWLHAHHRSWKGADGLAGLSIGEIEGLLYADAWCTAYDRSIWEYIEMFGTGRGREN